MQAKNGLLYCLHNKVAHYPYYSELKKELDVMLFILPIRSASLGGSEEIDYELAKATQIYDIEKRV